MKGRDLGRDGDRRGRKHRESRQRRRHQSGRAGGRRCPNRSGQRDRRTRHGLPQGQQGPPRRRRPFRTAHGPNRCRRGCRHGCHRCGQTSEDQDIAQVLDGRPANNQPGPDQPPATQGRGPSAAQEQPSLFVAPRARSTEGRRGLDTDQIEDLAVRSRKRETIPGRGRQSRQPQFASTLLHQRHGRQLRGPGRRGRARHGQERGPEEGHDHGQVPPWGDTSTLQHLRTMPQGTPACLWQAPPR